MPDNSLLKPPTITEFESFVCVQLRLPNEKEWFELFAGKMRELGLWNSYDRTDDKRGKVVADIWRDIWDNAIIKDGECMSDPLIEETNQWLAKIYALLKSGGTFKFNGGAIEVDPLPDCAPNNFVGNPDETPEEFILRSKALCLAVRRLVSRVVYDEMIKLGLKSRDVSVLSNSLEPLPVGSFASWQGTQVDGLVSGDFVLLETSSVAFDFAVCCLFEHWYGLTLTIENFKAGMSDCPPPLIPLTTEDRFAKIIPYYLAQDKNFSVFGNELDRAYSDVKVAPSEFDQDCGCTPPLPCAVHPIAVVANFGGHYPACPVEQIGVNKFRFTGVVAPDGFSDIYLVAFATDAIQCAKVQALEFVFQDTPPHAPKDMFYELCDGFTSNTQLVPPACIKQVYFSFAGNGSTTTGEFYVDVTFDGCDCE